ncbi:hypothetical protein BU17DRAFT_68093 [Hysterangium stoloniferum]|nr:hypothetical protein BU17DRAFT_68093 [Hysterangium stoloniferum]
MQARHSTPYTSTWRLMTTWLLILIRCAEPVAQQQFVPFSSNPCRRREEKDQVTIVVGVVINGVEIGIKIGRVVGVAVQRWNFNCGAGYTGIAIVVIAATTVVGPVPPASPLPPTVHETLCGYAVEIDAPDPKTGTDLVSDIPLDLGPLASAANIKSPPPDPNVPSPPPPLRAKHKPSHDFRRGPLRDGMSKGGEIGIAATSSNDSIMAACPSSLCSSLPAKLFTFVIANRVLRLRSCGGSIIKVPGSPDPYDYEWHPQDPRSPSRIPWVMHQSAFSLSWAYEPINGCAVQEWFVQDGQDFFCVGVGIGEIELGDNADASGPAGNGHLEGTGPYGVLNTIDRIWQCFLNPSTFSASPNPYTNLAKRMGEKLAKAWCEGGLSKETINRFVQKFILNE